MNEVTQIADGVYRLSTFVPQANLQFNQFLLIDDEPLLYHTGLRSQFPIVKDLVGRVMDPSKIRWIGFSHFEADECGALREWQETAAEATAVCSFVAKVISIDDVVAQRPARPLADGDRFSTGKRTYRFLQTPHVPHCWEAGLLYEETQKLLLCSDLFHQNGNVEAVTTSDVTERFRQMLLEYQQSPLAHYIPYTADTDRILKRLASLKPEILATMHGSTYVGDGERALHDLADVARNVLGPPA
jgi:flavorubredoxin